MLCLARVALTPALFVRDMLTEHLSTEHTVTVALTLCILCVLFLLVDVMVGTLPTTTGMQKG